MITENHYYIFIRDTFKSLRNEHRNFLMKSTYAIQKMCLNFRLVLKQNFTEYKLYISWRMIWTNDWLFAILFTPIDHCLSCS